MDEFLAALKFLAILSTGIWGVVGLLVHYKDRQGKITYWGRRALMGVVLSTIIAALTQGGETYKQRQNREREYAKTQQILMEIRRAVHSLKDIRADARISMSLKHTGLEHYLNRIRKELMSLAAKEGGWENVSHVSLPLQLHPTSDDKIAWRLFEDFGLEFSFYRQPIDPNDYQTRPDLIIPTHKNADHFQLSVSRDLDFIDIIAWDLKADPEFTWDSNGSIASLLDLIGSQVFVTMRYDEWDDSHIVDILNDSEIPR